ncbi:MAG: hypothetical protein KFH87_04205 [Bacteroidetes bacterium]|nr:hypothetical protein [Bacteroidota bacterium]
MHTQPPQGQRLYIACAGAGVLLFFLGPPLALLADVDALTAATIGYAGIALFTGGVSARYSFAIAAHPVTQLLKNLAVGLVVTLLFYAVFLLLFFL